MYKRQVLQIHDPPISLSQQPAQLIFLSPMKRALSFKLMASLRLASLTLVSLGYIDCSQYSMSS